MKNANTNAVTNVTTTTSIEIKKEDTTMKSTTSNKAPIVYNGNQISNAAFRRLAYDAYLRYVEMITGKITGETFAKAIKPYLQGFGIPMSQQTMSILSGYMVNYGSVNHEKALKIKGVAAFKTFTLSLYKEIMGKVEEGKVISRPGKAPAQPKTKAKTTKTKTEKAMEAKNNAKIAALVAKLGGIEAVEKLLKVEG